MPYNDKLKKPRAGRSTGPDAPVHLPGGELADSCRTILAMQATAVSIRDPELNPIYINRAFEDLFDVSLEEWRQSDMASHLGPKGAAIIMNQALPAVKRTGGWQGELEIRTADNSSKHVITEMNRILGQDGKISHYFNTYIDITRLKELENSLYLQVDYLNNILDTVPDPIFVKDEQHNWIVSNKAHCAFLGLTREEAVGKSDYDYFPREEADVFWAKDDEAFASGEENVNEEFLTDTHGVTHIISTKKATFTQYDGQRILVGVIRNITKERRLTEALTDSYSQLQKAFMDLQDRLRGIQSHIASEMTRTEAIQEIINRSSEEFQQFANQLGQKISQDTPPVRRLPTMSRREHQVFILLAQGRRIKDVAEHLGLSANTVSTYLSRIMKKLNLSSKAELIQYALRSGLA